MKIQLILLTLFLLNACIQEQDERDFLNKKKSLKYESETYAVVWTTVSLQKRKMAEHVPNQTKQLLDLWEKGIVENIYFNVDEKFGTKDTWPNIMFFLKAKNIDKAKEILDEMEFVKYKYAKYDLHPVGVLWLKRNENTLVKVLESKNSYAVVWSNNDIKLSDADVEKQAADFTRLWDQGYIENAYFDIVGASTGNIDRPTVVNFVNAKNADEAHKILSNLHFVKENIATYMLFDVGVLWKGLK